jgi:hypothetical protein
MESPNAQPIAVRHWESPEPSVPPHVPSCFATQMRHTKYWELAAALSERSAIAFGQECWTLPLIPAHRTRAYYASGEERQSHPKSRLRVTAPRYSRRPAFEGSLKHSVVCGTGVRRGFLTQTVGIPDRHPTTDCRGNPRPCMWATGCRCPHIAKRGDERWDMVRQQPTALTMPLKPGPVHAVSGQGSRCYARWVGIGLHS